MSEHDYSQLGAYALGALDPVESREVDEHLATCAECRAELAELEEMKEFLGEVPPEAFLDGPPDDGDLLLQRTLREVRETPARKSRWKPWLLAAAAVVVVAGVLGGGVLIGRQTVEQADAPVPGSKVVTAADATTGATMTTTVEPREGWAWIKVQITGLKPGDECVMLVTDKAGKTWTAGSWLISDKAAHDGSRFGGGVLVPPDQVKSVEIKTVQGKHVVTTTV
ncbi:zf-HC2 domain-containing protein [Kribbella albertanoniae]|uniref:Anti-sigma factor n=1 Tax=Kribbella albertanoniae TaxID=1266829 RepID=A0A4R4PZL1_9ACTN|nr:zf-HC2 domain-containing protein [Kribbella albertanoniae]TDC27942.1 anti-sigma factor [Kribbella albertanoniae]